MILSLLVINDPGISDHSAVLFTLALHEPQYPVKTISFHKIKSINIDKFIADINKRPLLTEAPCTIDDLNSSYKTELLPILDAHAALKMSTITLRNDGVWSTDELLAGKKNLCP